MNAIILNEPFIEMKSHEFPDSIEATQVLIQQLAQQIEEEGDRDKRRELFLYKMELRDHIHSLKEDSKK